jgi:alkanesulfonate monooxygenase SsuD/methylene tetrahydromethanopterin reductase-like flavin-dependent oxidoreductase (luciferase family)
MKWGVALGWHCLPWERLVEVVAHAESQGFDTAYIDGDVTQLGKRRDADVLDGWTATMALVARTRRIRIASIRLVQHWNPARLAQVMATAERIAPGRTPFFTSIGDRPEDPAWGMPRVSARERIAWLDEVLDAVSALWRGEIVTRRGRYVTLEEARVRPTPPGGRIPVEIGAKGAHLLEVVARRADIWNVNWPAIPARVEASAEVLARACRRIGRPIDAISRRMWIFTRMRPLPAARALAEFRRWNPWFDAIHDAELAPALVVGPPDECRDRLRELQRTGPRDPRGLPRGPNSLTPRFSVS